LDVVLYDTTLRDGTQQVGISLTCDDKLEVASHLVDLGVGYVEGGYPGSNPKDAEFFERWFSEGLAEKAKANNVTLVAFGMTRRRNVRADQDEGLRALRECPAPCVCIVAKAWEEQCQRVLGVDAEENLLMVSESVEVLVRHGKDVIVDCEHFFDGYAANEAFAVQVAVAAAKAGASHVVLCDTNGGSMPWVCEAGTAAVVQALSAEGLDKKCRVGTHAHNDTSLAVANSLAGVRGGARMVQGCVNGYGERTGNADLLVVAGNLQLKMKKKCFPGHDDGGACLTKITRVASAVASACGQPLDPKQAYVGSNAFAHKGGLHVAALAKMPSSYNHVVPGLVGNKQRAVVSELSGRGNIVAAARDSGREVSPETATKVLAQIKDMERRGFVLEDAGATVEILFNRADPMYRAPFNVVEFTCHLSNNSFSGGGGFGAGELDEGDVDVNSTANTNPSPVQALAGYKKGSVAVNQVVVKVDLFAYDDNDAESAAPVAMKTTLCVSEGNGPVNALANALRLALSDEYPQLRRIHLRDYKVDLLSTGGTSAATTRVTMDFADTDSDVTWRTVGAHASIVEASFRALVDGMEFGIARCGTEGCAVGFAKDEAEAEAGREPAPTRR
jgi:2-isopropylmalate synthase